MSTKYPERFYGDKKIRLLLCVRVYLNCQTMAHTHTFASRPKLAKKWKSVACHNSHNEIPPPHHPLKKVDTPKWLTLWHEAATSCWCLAVGATPYIHSHIRLHFHLLHPPPCQTKWQAVKMHVSLLPPPLPPVPQVAFISTYFLMFLVKL